MAKPDNHVDLVIVVSGAPEAVRINRHQTLEHAVREALRESGNKGQRPEDWELRNEAGQLLGLGMRPDEAGLFDGHTLFLSPKAGAGG
ncbi:DUF2604 domain-containing protein [Nocardioides glacieisoli]|uniref:DUF2604 domain-containing protein n=1 Tax=Nocardioides glacieisoli TaxID=1168730 RepID=A0A4Q2RLJ0_9ACTN|nr:MULTISPECIES: DUF2604 domain-containing protein [Nocardioides]MBS2937076.1 DUF2604 domain-containing protein [Nocardioides palaemonis]RYB88664.1 DUF2604 domain-containing protein [Nocardioides glacieisoli]